MKNKEEIMNGKSISYQQEMINVIVLLHKQKQQEQKLFTVGNGIYNESQLLFSIAVGGNSKVSS